MAQQHALHVERTAERAFMLSDRVKLSSAEARVEGIVGGSVGVFASACLLSARFAPSEWRQGHSRNLPLSRHSSKYSLSRHAGGNPDPLILDP